MILAGIITYNPDVEILMENIKQIYHQVDKLLIIDNNSITKEIFIKKINDEFKNIEIIKNEKNVGIAEALNQVIRYSNTNNFEWALTLDQDSQCEENIILKYKNYLNGNLDNSNILLLTPQIEDINMKNKININESSDEVETAITSGSLINIKNSLEIGGFKSELFIDYVDFEFCLRGRLSNYKIIKINNAVLYHRLGEIKVKRLLGLDIIATNHSPLRRYYLFRNKVYIYRKYMGKYNKWIIKNMFSSCKVILIILFFEKRKFDNLKHILKGSFEGIFLK